VELLGFLPWLLVVWPDLWVPCSGSSMATGVWVAGLRSLTADVLVSRISCGFPMCGVGFLVRKEVDAGGLMIWCTLSRFGEKYWKMGRDVFSFVLAEDGLDSPYLGLFSGLMTTSPAADLLRSTDFFSAADYSLFQDLDGDGRCTPEERWIAAASWRSLSISWLSSCLRRRASSPSPVDPVGVRCLGDAEQRTFVSNLIFFRILFACFLFWRISAQDLFVIYNSSREMVVRASFF